MCSSGKDTSRKGIPDFSFLSVSVHPFRMKTELLNTWIDTYCGAELACIPPVPILCKLLLGAGLTLCWSISAAVTFHGCSWWTLVTH